MFSIIVPMDPDRLPLFRVTKQAYDSMRQKKEFIIPTRNEPQIRKYLEEHDLQKDVKIIPYTVEFGFNCSKALNIGLRNAQYDSVIITSPEVKPLTPVLAQFEKILGTNVICKVFDGDQNNNIKERPLVSMRCKSDSPAMYYLAMFNKADIEKINGWDEEFMKGYAYEDCDFGARFVRAGLPFVVRHRLKGLHQYHTRKVAAGYSKIKNRKKNRKKFQENNKAGIIKCSNGLSKLS